MVVQAPVMWLPLILLAQVWGESLQRARDILRLTSLVFKDFITESFLFVQ